MPQVRDRSLGANQGGDEPGQGPTWIVSIGGLCRTYPTVYVWLMPRGLRRFQESGHSHFVTFSCRHRQPYFSTAELFDLFVQCLEDMRVRFGVRVYGYVVMPEHVHLRLSEPAGVAQVSAQKTSANLGYQVRGGEIRNVEQTRLRVRAHEKCGQPECPAYSSGAVCNPQGLSRDATCGRLGT